MLRKKQSMNLGSLINSAEDMEATTGMDDDQMRDDVATLSALYPKFYMEFRNNQLYGTKMSGSDKADDANYNPLKKYETTDFPQNRSIKGKLKHQFDNAIKILNTGNIEGLSGMGMITGQLPPVKSLTRLPKSKVREMLKDAYETAWFEQKRNFNEIYPRKIQQKKTDADGFEIKL